MKVKFFLISILLIFYCCNINDSENSISNVNSLSNLQEMKPVEVDSLYISVNNKVNDFLILENNYQKLKLSNTINTSQNEYYPIPNLDGSILYFVGMDRSSQFYTKIDFTRTRDYGGEDIWVSARINGIYQDAKPLIAINDNTHQSVTGISGDYILVYGTYEESYKVDASGSNAGLYNGDIFMINTKSNSIHHLGQPVNSIFFESDAFLSNDGKVLFFVSDKNPLNGPYKQKGWKYNNSFWGNTDIWVSERVDDYWTQPINLGEVINTEFAERTPCISADHKKIYFSSNGHQGYGELDVFVSERLDMNSWTSWSKPKNLGEGINGIYNDWGFKLYDNDKKAMLASETKLPYDVDSRLLGNGDIRESNLRNGYKLYGKQSGSFNYNCRSDIYLVDLLNNFTTITIDDMLFDFNKYTINEENYFILDRLFDLVQENKDYKINIIGHTDDIGDLDYNQLLSEKRAEVIFTSLANMGVNKNRMNYMGYGETKPLVKNIDANNRKINRRVEITFNKN